MLLVVCTQVLDFVCSKINIQTVHKRAVKVFVFNLFNLLMFGAALKSSQSVLVKGFCAGLLFKNYAHSDGETKKSVALSSKEFRSFKISKITDLSPNTKSFIVDLPSKHDETVFFFNFWVSRTSQLTKV